jgi:hypothetical protein
MFRRQKNIQKKIKKITQRLLAIEQLKRTKCHFVAKTSVGTYIKILLYYYHLFSEETTKGDMVTFGVLKKSCHILGYHLRQPTDNINKRVIYIYLYS